MSGIASRALAVSLAGQSIGSLEINRSGLVSWVPVPEWEAGGQRPRLGVAFLRTPGVRSAGTGLPAWFENLLPETGSALLQRLCAVHGLRDGNRFGLLQAIGGDLSGAVEITAHHAANPSTVVSGPLLVEGSGATDSVSPELFRFSLAGMQPKLSMSMADERLVLRADGPQGQWIVKLPSRSFPELPQVEQATMSWAKAAGFDVPDHFTVKTDALEGVPASWVEDLPDAFAIRRFDRRDDGSKIHQEDLCQALELLPAYKHGDLGQDRVRLDGALRFVEDVAGEEAAREMSRRIGFIIASGNDDAHLKNWSLLWGNADRPSLTPCYDFVATISWPERFGWSRPLGPTLSLGIGGVERFALLSKDILQRHAEKSGLAWAAEETMQGVERARDAWASVENEVPRRMRDALVEHWQNVPLLRTLTPPWS